MAEPHRWERHDPHTVSVLRRTMDGYTLEIVSHGRNDRGPRRIATKAALRCIEGYGYREVRA